MKMQDAGEKLGGAHKDRAKVKQPKGKADAETVKKPRKKSNKPALPERPRLERLERIGPDHRQGDISPDAIVETFGIRGIEFGNWMTEAERQASVNLAYDAFMDLSDIMGIKPHDIGGGRLGVGFGSRGHGKFAAHYEADRVVINLTRFKGDGSLSHEMGHMFEHSLRQFFIDPAARTKKERYLASFASTGWCYPQRRDKLIAQKCINEAFLELMDAIMVKGRFGRAWTQTDYCRTAQRLGAYWVAPLEMFARAFESYCFDWLAMHDRKSEYLVHGVEGDRFSSHPRGNPYPKGDERERINEAMRRFLLIWRDFRDLMEGPGKSEAGG